MEPDGLERRCPRLGGEVNFGYCQTCGENRIPCFKIFDCWWERFDVVAYLKAHLSPKAFESLSKSTRPPDKVASLVDLIQQAQKRAETK